MLVEREVGDEPFQPAVFFFELTESAQLAHAQVGLLLSPGIKGGVADAELAAEIPDRGAGLGLVNRVDDLFFREL